MKPFVTAIIASTLIATLAMAQQQPPPPAEGGGGGGAPPPGDRQGPPGGGGRGGPRGEGRGGPDGRGPGGGPGMYGRDGDGMMGGSGMGTDPRMLKFEMLRGYFDAVDRYARLAHDPSITGIASVVAAADILRPRGANEAITYFEKVLPEAKSPAVQRAIRLQLVDLYKSVGKQDQALDQLKTLMTAEPGPNDLQQPAPPPPPGGGPNR